MAAIASLRSLLFQNAHMSSSLSIARSNILHRNHSDPEGATRLFSPFTCPRISRAFLKAASKASHWPGRILPQTIRMCIWISPCTAPLRRMSQVTSRHHPDSLRPECWPLDYLWPNALANNRATLTATSSVAGPQPSAIADRAPAPPTTLPSQKFSWRSEEPQVPRSPHWYCRLEVPRTRISVKARPRPVAQNDPLEGLPLEPRPHALRFSSQSKLQ